MVSERYLGVYNDIYIKLFASAMYYMDYMFTVIVGCDMFNII